MNTEYVGILLTKAVCNGIQQGVKTREAIHLYDEIGTKYGLIPSYFSLYDYSQKKKQVYALIRKGNEYERKWIPLPQVIHNRVLLQSREEIKLFHQLEKQGTILFNRQNRYNKLEVHRHLHKKTDLRPHLPKTLTGTIQNLKQMLDEFPSLILKPAIGSLGKGIMRLSQTDHGWLLTYPAARKKNAHLIREFFSHSLPLHVVKTMRQKSYIIQEEIPIATYQGRPFDLRVSVQKNEHSCWQVTGMIAKVARPGHFLCNVAQGGTVYPLEKLLGNYPHLKIDMVEDKITRLALNIVEELEQHYPGLADVGLDLAITRNGFPYFIECNGRDQRYSFLNGGMVDTWKQTYFNPIGYARFLLDYAEEDAT